VNEPLNIEELEAGFTVGKWRVLPHRNTISRDGEEKHLENRLMRTLLFLAEQEGNTVTREHFFESVWQGRVVNEEALSRAISLLRTALEDHAHAPEYIQTIPGVGYRLIAQVVRNNHASPSPSPARQVHDNSIAVLPFVNLSKDPDNEYFSDGLTEELLNLLAGIDELKVAARTSSFYYKDKLDDIQFAEVARQLDVAHILEGSVRRSGNKIRITAQLIKASDGFHMWSETYDRELDDIFAIQDGIAAAVTEQLRITLLGESPHSKVINTESWELAQKGRFY